MKSFFITFSIFFITFFPTYLFGKTSNGQVAGLLHEVLGFIYKS